MELKRLCPHATMNSFVYKTVGEVDISIDVYLPDVTKFGLVATEANNILRGIPVDKDADTTLPIVLYFHGGGATSGNREINDWFPKYHLVDSLNAGWCFISAEYTLLSPFTAHQILADVKDCVTFIAEKLNNELAKLPYSQLINPNRIAVSGSSGGGYPAYLAALHANPRPKALAPIYGMGGDILSDHYFTEKTAPFFHNVNELIPDEHQLPLFHSPPTNTPIVSTGLIYPQEPRTNYCVWLIQKGIALSALLGLPASFSENLGKLPFSERGAALAEKDRKLFPQLNVDSTFPATVFLHGVDDTGVLIEESRNMFRLLKAAGVETELLESPGQHCFDLMQYDEDRLEKQNMNKMMEFLIKHV